MSAERASDPSSSAETLKELAFHFPVEVRNNPVLPLLFLENPAFYEELVKLIKLGEKNQRRLFREKVGPQILLWGGLAMILCLLFNAHDLIFLAIAWVYIITLGWMLLGVSKTTE